MTKLALLVPTRDRPEQCERMIESVWKTSQCEPRLVKILLGVDKNDPCKEKYLEIAGRYDDVDILWMNDEPTVYKWNQLAMLAMDLAGPMSLFMLGADDVVFETKGWDTALIDHYEGLENKIHVYHLQDSRDADGTPHPIVTREWINALGYAFPPIFLHWYVDTWTVGIASSVDAFTHLKGFSLVHDKLSDRGTPDETHNRIRRAGWHSRDKHVNDTCGHFLQYEIGRLSEKMHMGRTHSLGPRATGVYHEELRQTREYFAKNRA